MTVGDLIEISKS